jgi:uncharacterized protein (DUF302 family)
MFITLGRRAPLPTAQQGKSVYYVVESSKSFSEVIFDLEPVVQRLGFVVLHGHDLGDTLRRKGIDLDDDCQVFDICNYRQIEKMLAIDLRLSLALPWRISVYTENGATKIGLLRPESLLATLSDHPELVRLGREVEERVVQIVDEVR